MRNNLALLILFAALSLPQLSFASDALRETATHRQGLALALKHYSRPGAIPVLLIHGLSQNDRIWDSPIPQYNFARFLYDQGFDVWIGNLRDAGTAGFRSEDPPLPHHWDVDDYAIYDVPTLIQKVQTSTGQSPWIIGHSLAAWSLEGYLAGLSYDSSGQVRPNWALGAIRQQRLRGIVTIAGIFNARWKKSVDHALTDPIRSVDDYYQSNYELELFAKVKPLYYIVPHLPDLPLSWIGSVLFMRLDQIPWIGSRLLSLYAGLQDKLIETPVFNMFFYSPDCDPDVVRLHLKDGMDEISPHILEQLGNAINAQKLLGYFHLSADAAPFEYARERSTVTIPELFIAGGHDRLANAQTVYEDGYLASSSPTKDYIRVEDAGHLDIIDGIHAREEVMLPVSQWMKTH